MFWVSLPYGVDVGTCICSYVLLYCESSGGRDVFGICVGLLLFGLFITIWFVSRSGLVYVPFGMLGLVFLVCAHGGVDLVFGSRCRLCGFSVSVYGCVRSAVVVFVWRWLFLIYSDRWEWFSAER